MAADMKKSRQIHGLFMLIPIMVLLAILLAPWKRQGKDQLVPRDLEEVDRIVLDDNYQSTELLKQGEGWYLFGSEPVNPVVMETLLTAAGRLELVSIVENREAEAPGERMDAYRNVSYFKGDKRILSYTLRAVSGKFMLIPPDSESSYFVSVPGYPGLDLNRVFSATPDHYRESLLIDLLPSEISGIEIELASGEAFNFVQDGEGNIRCEAGNEHSTLPPGETDELSMRLLFSYFTSIRYEERTGIPADSLLRSAGSNSKLASIRVSSFKGERHSMQVFTYHETVSSGPHLFRALVLYNEEQEAIFVNYIYLDVLMRSLSHYFGEK